MEQHTRIIDRQTKSMAMEKKHVHDVYERTAHHFRDVRYKAWPRVRQFLSAIEPGALVADVGCGTGKYLHINKDVFKVGCDRSGALIDIAHARHHSVLVCDNLNLPYRDNCFDAVISIGVIHHLTTRERRARALRELARVLRPGGKLMVYVWAMEQKHRKFEAQDVLVPWNFQSTSRHKRKKELSRLMNTQSDTFSDEEMEQKCRLDMHHTYHHHYHHKHSLGATPVNHSKALRHHTLGEEPPGGGNVKTLQDCKQKRKSFHKQRDFMYNVHSSHSRDGGSSSCASITSPSVEFTHEDFGSSTVPSASDAKAPSLRHCSDVQKANDKSLKSWVVNLFSGGSQSKANNPGLSKSTFAHAPSKKLKDYEYKQLICQIMKEDLEMFNKHRPLLEHSLSAPDATADLFAVREFPQSSQPELRKFNSLDSGKPQANAQGSLEAKEDNRISQSSLEISITETTDVTTIKTVALQGSFCGSEDRVNVYENATLDNQNTGQLDNDGNSNECKRNGNNPFNGSGSVKTSSCPNLTADDANSNRSNFAVEFPNDIARLPKMRNINRPSVVSNQNGCVNGSRRNVAHPDQSSTSGSNESEPDVSGKNGARTTAENRQVDRNGAAICHREYVLNGAVAAASPTSDSSPESPYYGALGEANGLRGEASQDGSSMSSPEEDLAIRRVRNEDGDLPGLLEEVAGIQYPSLSDSDADEWAKVTVKAIRMMQSEVLRKAGTSTESTVSRQAVLGSSADLQDVEDDDLKSPRWLEAGADAFPTGKLRFLPHGSSCGESTSSLSSDPYSESDGDEAGNNVLKNFSVVSPFMETLPPKDITYVFGHSKKELAACSETRFQPATGKSDLLSRRRMLRRLPSLSDHGSSGTEKSLGVSVTSARKEETAVNELSSEMHPGPPDKSESSGKKVKSEGSTLTLTIKDSFKLENAKDNFQNKNNNSNRPKGARNSQAPPIQPVRPLEESSAAEELQEDEIEGGTENTYHRYYHVFREGELVSLIEKHVEQLHIIESYFDNANWCVVAEKVQVWTL